MTAPSAEPTVRDLSEGDILRAILARLGPTSALVGPGDDAAVLAAPDGRVVATTDTLVHGPDFRLAWSTGYDLGWKAAAVNLADIAAMGARPTALLVALAMPGDTRLSFVEQFADGLRAACEALAPGCEIVGGDLTVSPTLLIAVTALGVLENRPPVLRSGARPGDVIAVRGDLGVARRGLDVLFRRFTDGLGDPIAVDAAALSASDAEAVARQLQPRPPIADGVLAAAAGATAMMDVSDGLALDATRMARASGVVLEIRSSALGADVAGALEGGEDHALLATFPAGADLGPFRPIGRVLEHVPDASAAPLLIDGSAYAGPGGWDPYRDWDAHGG
ncbi:thiamine-phosphate kinase [Microbacterium sp. zg.B48]|uniref:thiamine-phosphate kinase n=1 Tax=Microbacterium sp. zg.B48 TaxID=2969408 RepID=UPI00214CF474|nr:thiamine-phosphate kinase [Microbacterium sp. zg.B48]MCR2763647.1 thiamine-phosphate kinase [Microbacterium sp. zg.B48]